MPRLLLSLAFLILSLGGCAAPSLDAAPPTQGVHLRPLSGADTDAGWQGDRSTVTERLELIARTSEDWQRLWAKIGAPAPIALPDDRMAAALFLGTRATGGYAIHLDPAITASTETRIPYRESVPGPDDATDQTPTAPFAIRLISLAPGPVRFTLSP